MGLKYRPLEQTLTDHFAQVLYDGVIRRRPLCLDLFTITRSDAEPSMNTAMLIAFIVLLAAFGALLWWVGRLRRLLQTLDDDHRQLVAAWGALPPDTRHLLPQTAGALISIEILNPIALASTESSFAGPIGSIAPGLIRKLVYQRTIAMLREELLKHGVQAQVQTHGLD